MRITDSFKKTLMLGKIEGRRRGLQRMGWLDGSTDSIDMSDWTTTIFHCMATPHFVICSSVVSTFGLLQIMLLWTVTSSCVAICFHFSWVYTYMFIHWGTARLFCTILHSYQQPMRAPIPPHPCQHLLLCFDSFMRQNYFKRFARFISWKQIVSISLHFSTGSKFTQLKIEAP